MARPHRKAGGFFVAAGCLAGLFAGISQGQPSAGFLGGLALGVAAAVAVWLFDRGKR